MDEIAIQNMINQGEGLTVEFKSAVNDLPMNLFETVCAFLNRNGGTILLGVDDGKKVAGIDPDVVNILCKNFASLSNNPNKIDPVFILHPTVIDFRRKKIIHVFVPASSQVHKCNGKVFDRSVDGDFIVKTDQQISLMYLRKSTFFSEGTIYPFLNESDFANGVIERARRVIKINRPDHPWNELSNDDFFRTAGLYRRNIQTGVEGFTMAALLLFGKDEVIQSALPYYKVDAVVRKLDMDRYDDRETIRCNLIEAYDKLLAFTAKHLSDKFYLIGDQRVSLREKIFREIIANLLIHREYSNAFPSSFVIYNNKVETSNANKPHVYGQLYPDTFQPFPKNPCLAQIFTQMGRSEEFGTGLRNVYKYSKAYSGSEKIVFLEDDIFRVSIPLTGDATEKVTEKVTENQRKMIDIISDNKWITINELSKFVGISPRKIKENIRKLKDIGMLMRIGPDKGGYWEIIKK